MAGCALSVAPTCDHLHVWDIPDAGDGDRLDRLRIHLETAQRIADLGSWEGDAITLQLHWSPNVFRIFGWSGDTPPTYEEFLDIVHPDDRRRLRHVHEDAVQHGVSFSVDHRIVRADGVRYVHEEATVEHDGDGRPVRVIGVVQDTTARTLLTRSVVETESKRRALLHRLVQAGEEARARLAGDLHDGPIQLLTVAAMRLEHLHARHDDPPPWLRGSIEAIREAMVQLRDTLVELHPTLTSSPELEARIQHVAATVLPKLPTTVSVTGMEPGARDGQAVLGLLQETLWAARERDAEPTCITVEVTGDEIRGCGTMNDRTGELQRVLRHLQTAHRTAGLGSWEAELDAAHSLYWSPEVFEIAGLPTDEPPTFEGFVRLIHPDDRPLFLQIRSQALTGERPYDMDLRMIRPDGSPRHVHLLAEVLVDEHGTPQRLIGTVQDRTDEVAALRRLRTTEAARRDLLQRLIDAAEIERRRLAERLSSGPIEGLTAVRDVLDQQAVRDPAGGLHEARHALRRAIESLDAALSVIDSEATRGDLRGLVDELVAESTPAPVVEIDVPTMLALGPSLQATVVRVVQEALHNVRKHAAATRVAVSVRERGDAVVVEVVDDGRGFDVATAESRRGHLGLISMRERVEVLGGDFHLSSRPGRTTVSARLPLA